MSNGQFQRNLSFFKVPEGVQHFPGGSNFFQGRGGVQLLIPYRNPYNLWFSRGGGGSGPPVPPLWIRTWFLKLISRQVIHFFNQKMAIRKTCVKRPLTKRPKNGFQDQLLLNAGQKYCRMLHLEHSAILLTFIKLPTVIKIFILSIFKRPLYTGFTVCFF